MHLSPSNMVHHRDLLLVCPDFPIFLLGLGGQHPSCVGLSKNKKKGENKDAHGEERNNKKQARKEMKWGGPEGNKVGARK